MKKILIIVCCINYIVTLGVYSTAVSAETLTQGNQLLQTYTNNKYYNQVCWLTSHNSFAYAGRFISDSVLGLYPNQKIDIQRQLSYGVRSFMVDLYYEDDSKKSLVLAHRVDLPYLPTMDFYTQKFSFPFLSTVRDWLNDPKHRDDIITIHLESYIRDYQKIINELDAIDEED